MSNVDRCLLGLESADFNRDAGSVVSRCSPRQLASGNSREISNMWDWFPIVFITFKVIVFGTAMFFAIKWHYDQDRKNK